MPPADHPQHDRAVLQASLPYEALALEKARTTKVRDLLGRVAFAIENGAAPGVLSDLACEARDLHRQIPVR
jgi:hypothetical protein